MRFMVSGHASKSLTTSLCRRSREPALWLDIVIGSATEAH